MFCCVAPSQSGKQHAQLASIAGLTKYFLAQRHSASPLYTVVLYCIQPGFLCVPVALYSLGSKSERFLSKWNYEVIVKRTKV